MNKGQYNIENDENTLDLITNFGYLKKQKSLKNFPTELNQCEVCLAISPNYKITLYKTGPKLEINFPSPKIGKEQLSAFARGTKFLGLFFLDGTTSAYEHYIICMAFRNTLPEKLISFDELAKEAMVNVQNDEKQWMAEIGPTLKTIFDHQTGIKLTIEKDNIDSKLTYLEARDIPSCKKFYQELSTKYYSDEQQYKEYKEALNLFTDLKLDRNYRPIIQRAETQAEKDKLYCVVDDKNRDKPTQFIKELLIQNAIWEMAMFVLVAKDPNHAMHCLFYPKGEPMSKNKLKKDVNIKDAGVHLLGIVLKLFSNNPLALRSVNIHFSSKEKIKESKQNWQQKKTMILQPTLQPIPEEKSDLKKTQLRRGSSSGSSVGSTCRASPSPTLNGVNDDQDDQEIPLTPTAPLTPNTPSKFFPQGISLLDSKDIRSPSLNSKDHIVDMRNSPSENKDNFVQIQGTALTILVSTLQDQSMLSKTKQAILNALSEQNPDLKPYLPTTRPASSVCCKLWENLKKLTFWSSPGNGMETIRFAPLERSDNDENDPTENTCRIL